VLGAAIERERADDALRESEERFRRLAAATFEGIDITEGGLILDVNEQMARMVGAEVRDLIGRPALDFVPPESADLVKARQQVLSDEPYHHLVRRLDGTVFPVEVRTRTLPHEGRSVRISAVRDVTERVQAEERQRRLEDDLRQAAEQWRQTFDALDLGIVLADAQGNIVRLNRSALELAAGHSFADAVGASLEELAAREPWGRALEIHRRVGETGATATAEARDGTDGRAYYLLGSPWFRAGDEPWRVVTFRDVTEFTRMQGQLRRAQTLQAMGTLVAGVAHEVRNPLFSISASVDALEAVIGERSEVSDCTGLLRSQVHRLNQLMRDLLDYGKPSVLRLAPAQLADVLRRAFRSCAGLARDREVTVEEHLAAGLPAVVLDSPRVEQVLENLLANAIQHSPKGARVVVSGDLDEAEKSPVLRCVVEDEGPGLPVEDVAKVFEPFFSRRKGGTGLGLSIVQRIVEAHGGRILAGNREMGGARFEVRLPIRPPEAGPLG
jgi:PAS domain S-box-containing protein